MLRAVQQWAAEHDTRGCPIEVLTSTTLDVAHAHRRDLELHEIGQACEGAVERHFVEQERLAAEQRQREADERERLDRIQADVAARRGGDPTPQQRIDTSPCLALDRKGQRKAQKRITRYG